ncbi:MAG: RecX family transcriptional regulator [Muribaculaceae bacterium]|nr:RecX family transcriptional regulator [Muribaculaceae bacterium]
MKISRIVTAGQMLQRMASLCARSEQCSADIEKKLRAKALSQSDIASILETLREGKFIDDARFARAFANDKVRFSGWGRRKIQAELRLRRIPDSAVRDALEQIDAEEYSAIALRVASQKAGNLDLTQYADKMKLARFLAGRGYELDMVSSIVNKLASRQ